MHSTISFQSPPKYTPDSLSIRPRLPPIITLCARQCAQPPQDQGCWGAVVAVGRSNQLRDYSGSIHRSSGRRLEDCAFHIYCAPALTRVVSVSPRWNVAAEPNQAANCLPSIAKNPAIGDGRHHSRLRSMVRRLLPPQSSDTDRWPETLAESVLPWLECAALQRTAPHRGKREAHG